jgi:Fur family peroxide stress response transcriptional regulator
MEGFLKKYKEAGLKLTPQRIAILTFLDGNTGHPTAEEIFAGVRETYPTVSFATVYNTLQALTTRGQLTEVTINPERKHFDPNTEPHHHAMCSGCDKIVDIFDDYSEALSLPQNVGDGFEGFSITGNHVEFYGVCADCTE